MERDQPHNGEPGTVRRSMSMSIRQQPCISIPSTKSPLLPCSAKHLANIQQLCPILVFAPVSPRPPCPQKRSSRPIPICGLWARRYPASTNCGTCRPHIGGISHARLRTWGCAALHIIRHLWTRTPGPGHPRHLDGLCSMTIRETVAKRIGNWASIRIVVAWLAIGPRVVVVGLVGVEVWERRDSVWVW